MKKSFVIAGAAVVLAGVAALTVPAAITYFEEPQVQLSDLTIGQAAPPLTLPDHNGRPVSLAQFRGKPVVLEWNNPGCPFVKKQYGSGTMQRAHAAAARDGVVWLTVNSSAPGKQGHMDADEAREFLAESGARPAAYLLDPNGVAGRAYGARTTPHMFVIDGEGTLVYAGAIDSSGGSDAPNGPVRNHVLAALAEMKAGKPVSVASSRPFGCSVKYG